MQAISNVRASTVSSGADLGSTIHRAYFQLHGSKSIAEIHCIGKAIDEACHYCTAGLRATGLQADNKLLLAILHAISNSSKCKRKNKQTMHKHAAGLILIKAPDIDSADRLQSSKEVVKPASLVGCFLSQSPGSFWLPQGALHVPCHA